MDLTQISKSMSDHVSRYIIPIYRSYNGFVELLGTGTLFEICDMRLIITAKHVLDYKSKDVDLYISESNTDGKGIPLQGKCIREKNYDIGYVILENETKDVLLKKRSFANQGMVDKCNNRSLNSIYYILGYPGKNSQSNTNMKTVRSEAINYLTVPYIGNSKVKLEGYDPEAHIILDNKNNVSIETNKPTNLPPLYGISGSSIWNVIEKNMSLEKWNVNDAKICGIQTCIYELNKNGAIIIRATKWIVLYQLLIKNHPEINDALKLVFPYQRN